MSREKHGSKSNRAKAYYVNAIKKTDYEATRDESLPFGTSDKGEEDYSQSPTDNRRPVSWNLQLSDHIKENWITWIFGLIGAFVIWITFDLNRSLGKIEGQMVGSKI